MMFLHFSIKALFAVIVGGWLGFCSALIYYRVKTGLWYWEVKKGG